MTEHTSTSQTVRRWYTRPVFFVADVNRAARSYVEMLGFEKGWHAGDGSGKACQVNHGECEIILCEDATRPDRGRLFIELTSEGLADVRREFAERSVPTKETWWGYDTLQSMILTAMSCCSLVRTEAGHCSSDLTAGWNETPEQSQAVRPMERRSEHDGGRDNAAGRAASAGARG